MPGKRTPSIDATKLIETSDHDNKIRAPDTPFQTEGFEEGVNRSTPGKSNATDMAINTILVKDVVLQIDMVSKTGSRWKRTTALSAITQTGTRMTGLSREVGPHGR
jgi:hypothetical protein